MLCKAKNKNNYMDCTNSLYNLKNHCSFHPEKRLVNLERGRERFVGLFISNSLCLRPSLQHQQCCATCSANGSGECDHVVPVLVGGQSTKDDENIHHEPIILSPASTI